MNRKKGLNLKRAGDGGKLIAPICPKLQAGTHTGTQLLECLALDLSHPFPG